MTNVLCETCSLKTKKDGYLYLCFVYRSVPGMEKCEHFKQDGQMYFDIEFTKNKEELKKDDQPSL